MSQFRTNNKCRDTLYALNSIANSMKSKNKDQVDTDEFMDAMESDNNNNNAPINHMRSGASVYVNEGEDEDIMVVPKRDRKRKYETNVASMLNNQLIGIVQGGSYFDVPGIDRDKIPRQDGLEWEKGEMENHRYFTPKYMDEQIAKEKVLMDNKDYQFVTRVAGCTNVMIERLYDLDDPAFRVRREMYMKSDYDSRLKESEKVKFDRLIKLQNSAKSEVDAKTMEIRKKQSEKNTDDKVISRYIPLSLETRELEDSIAFYTSSQSLIVSMSIGRKEYNIQYVEDLYVIVNHFSTDSKAVTNGSPTVIIKREDLDRLQKIIQYLYDMGMSSVPATVPRTSEDIDFIINTSENMFKSLQREYKEQNENGKDVPNIKDITDWLNIEKESTMLIFNNVCFERAESLIRVMEYLADKNVLMPLDGSPSDSTTGRRKDSFILSKIASKIEEKPASWTSLEIGEQYRYARDLNNTVKDQLEKFKRHEKDVLTLDFIADIINMEEEIMNELRDAAFRDPASRSAANVIAQKHWTQYIKDTEDPSDHLVTCIRKYKKLKVREIEKLKKEEEELIKTYSDIKRRVTERSTGRIDPKDLDIPYAHNRKYVEHPLNSGFVKVIPLFVSGVEGAYNKLQQYIPSGKYKNVAVETLQYNEIIRADFALLVSIEMSILNFRFPKQYQIKEMKKFNTIDMKGQLQKMEDFYSVKVFVYREYTDKDGKRKIENIVEVKRIPGATKSTNFNAQIDRLLYS